MKKKSFLKPIALVLLLLSVNSTQLSAQTCSIGTPSAPVTASITNATVTAQSFTAPCSGQFKSITYKFSNFSDDFRGTQAFLKCNLRNSSNVLLATGVMPNGKDTTDNVYPNKSITVDFNCANAIATTGTQYVWELVAVEQAPNIIPFGGVILFSYTTNIMPGGNYIADGVQKTLYDVQGFTVNIGAPNPALTSTQTQTNATCGTCPNGAASVTASGSTGIYTYSWSPSGGTGSTATGLLPNTYTCTIKSCGQTITNTFTITGACPTVTTAIASQTNVLCNGSATGAITLNASGGSGFTYSWSPSGGTSAIAGSLSAGTYSCLVTNSCGSSTTAIVNITQPVTSLATATAVTNVLCNGNSTGSATVTTSGGTTGYTYLWSSAQTTSVITGLNVGIRTITVTDANGCTSQNTVTINQPASALATSTSVTNVLCNGGNTGSATVTASGGTSGFTYLWSTGATTSVIASQTTGVKTVTVTDANGCKTTNTVSISQPVTLSVTATANPAAICAGQTSTLTASASGGNSSYTYTWSAGPGTATYTVNPGSNASYTVSATDANGCSLSTTVNVNVNTAPTLTVNTGSICSGNSFTIIPGGAISYTYSGGTAVVSPTATTNYTVTGSNGAGCTSTIISTVTVNAKPTVSVSSGAICNGNSFTMTATGASTYTYSSGTAIVSPTTTTSYSVTGTSAAGCLSSNTAVSSVTVNALPFVSVNSGSICKGSSFTMSSSGASTYTYSSGTAIVSPTTTTSYSVTGTSVAGCVSSNTAVSNVTVNTIPVISVPSATICSGSTTTLTASGASTYTWSTGSNLASIAVSPTVNTTYTINGTSAAGCAALPVTPMVTVGSAPNISVNSSTICAGNTATLTVSGVDTYTWSTNENTSSINVTPGSTTVYTITGNLTGCAITATNTTTVTVNALPIISINSGAVCIGQSFTMTPGGAVSYTYSSGSGIVTPSVNASYTVTGTGANGCENYTVAMVNVNSLPIITENGGKICPGNFYTFNPGGAVTYTFSSITNTVMPTVNTSYTVSGTDINGCINSAVTTVTVVNLNVSISQTSVTCYGGNNGTATATITGGDAPYIYLWSPNGANAASLTNLGAGSYTCSVADANNCIAKAITAIVEPTDIMLNAQFTPIICHGGISTISVSATGGFPSYTGTGTYTTMAGISQYSVTDNNGCVKTTTLNITQPASINITTTSIKCYGGTVTVGSNVYSATGTYTDVLQTANGCDSTIITNLTVLSKVILNQNKTICSGQFITVGSTAYNSAGTYTNVLQTVNGCDSTVITTLVVNSTPTITVSNAEICLGQSYTLSATGAITFTFSSGSIVSPVQTTQYTVTGQNASGCTSNAVLTITVNALPTVNAGNDVELVLGNSYNLNPLVTNAVTFSWSPANGLSSATILNPVATPETDTQYTLTVTSAKGCVASDDIAFKVNNTLEISNFISPNNDGNNDTWNISVPFLVKDFSITIVDQWGNKVYSKANNYNNEWDAKNVIDGVYYYVISDAGKSKYSGSITVLR